MSSLWAASDRFGLSTAPGGAALVQDFLNTRAIGQYPDLLADSTVAQIWANDAARAWCAIRGLDADGPPVLTEADVTKLRTLRTALARLAGGNGVAGPGPVSVSASFHLSETGDVQLQPTGTGWRWLASALWGEVLLSQRADVWRRLKICRNPKCASVFYDRSKNNSGVWHDVKVCGNAVNLRSSRARRRHRSGPDPS